MPDSATLRELVVDGSVDTVVLAFPDIQGRPVGKRVTGSFFLDHAGEHGIEVCDYLLAVDVDMNPLPGYRFTNWDTGYGNLVAAPDFSTTRVLPWLDGTALVICDLLDRAGRPVEVSPRRILQRQIERAHQRGFTVRCATELEFFLFRDSFEQAADKGWRGLVPHTGTIEDYQLLQTSREEYVLRRIRNEMVRAGIPIESSKGEAGRGQHRGQRHVRRGARDGRPPSRLQERREGDRRPGGPGRDVHGEVVDGRGRIVVPPPHQPVGRGHRPPADGPRRRPDRAVGRRSALPRRPDPRRRPAGVVLRPVRQLLPAVRVRQLGADGRGLGRGQPDEPYAHNVYAADDVPRIPTTLVEAIVELETSVVAAEALGDDIHHHLVNTARQEWAAANRVVTDWELARNFERI